MLLAFVSEVLKHSFLVGWFTRLPHHGIQDVRAQRGHGCHMAVIFEVEVVIHKFNSGHDPLIVLFGFLLFSLELFSSNLHLLKVAVDVVSPLGFEILHLELV